MDHPLLIRFIQQNLKDVGANLDVPGVEDAIRSAIDCCMSYIIDSEWHVLDVWHEIEPSFAASMMSFNDLKIILETVETNHDAEIGINWRVLRNEAESYIKWNSEELIGRFHDLMFSEGVGL